MSSGGSADAPTPASATATPTPLPGRGPPANAQNRHNRNTSQLQSAAGNLGRAPGHVRAPYAMPDGAGGGGVGPLASRAHANGRTPLYLGDSGPFGAADMQGGGGMGGGGGGGGGMGPILPRVAVLLKEAVLLNNLKVIMVKVSFRNGVWTVV